MLEWIFGSAPGGMAIVEYSQHLGGILAFANEALAGLTGYTREELVGMPAFKLIPEVSDEAESSRNELVAGKRTWWSDDVNLRTRHGEWKVVRLTVSSLMKSEGALFGIAHAEDVTEQRRESSRLEFLAGHDALTGLPGAQRMEEELLRFSHRQVIGDSSRALAVVDLDGLAYLNDRLGFAGGDQVIRAMASLVESMTADNGVAVRIGANRFALFWPDLDAGTVVIRTNSLLQQIRSDDFLLNLGEAARGVAFTASAGIAIVESGDSCPPSEILATADQALRKAKQGGRDCLVTVDIDRAPTGLIGLSETRELIAHGISDEGVFHFAAQPILDAATNE
ncbi:MAG: diguanylate cyclase, partial [Solirubrobacterales bacterium]